MQESRYQEMCENLDPSIESLLNLIRRYLQMNQASVMVGAGFSKNANLAPGARMKDWNELGKDFYEHLYAKEPQPEDLAFKSPVRFASQLASFTSHVELDKIISNSLPDLSVTPAELHFKLMQLPWRDVFTTNYDTLLERTRPQWVRHYNIVTNRDTLIYSKSPRIIKLHGSFPDQHPFIITEEDFRSYPNKYPEFVNTVRQSLIENLFCLIGFSGDDENFLSWIGWLRDVIGKESVMCYHITYNNDKHDSEIRLMQERGITPIDLKRLPLAENEGIAEALDFFLTYIKPSDNHEGSDWDGSMGLQPYDDLVADTIVLKRIHDSYPGWPFLPADKLLDFVDIETRAPYLDSKFSALESDQKYSFAKEILWRIKVSYSPLIYPWLTEYLEGVIEQEGLHTAELIDMSLILLSAYRRNSMLDKFKQLDKRLKSVIFDYQGLLLHTYLYEKALCYSTMLDFPSLRRIANIWHVPAEDTVPALWKANVLIILGEINEAKVLLEEALRHVCSIYGTSVTLRRQMLIDVLQTSLNAISGHFDGIASDKSLYVSCTNKLRIDLARFEKTGRPGQRVTHTFNIGRKQKSWHSGKAGLFGDYIYPYRYIAMREQIGLPFSIAKREIDIEHIKLFLTPFVKYEPTLVISCAIRSKSADVVKDVFTREAIHFLKSIEYNDLVNSSSFDVLKNPQSKEEDCIRNRVLIPLFSKMCIRLDQSTIMKIFDVVLDYTRNYPRRYDICREELRTIYDCANEESREYMLQRCLEMPIPDKTTPWELLMPECLSISVHISDEVVQYLADTMAEPTGEKERVLARLQKVWQWFTNEQKAIIQPIIIDWRSKHANDICAIQTYKYIHSEESERVGVAEICEQHVSMLEQYTWKDENSSNSKETINNLLYSLVCLSDELEQNQVNRVYRHLATIVEDVYCQEGDSAYNEFVMNNQDFVLREFNRYFRIFIRKTSERLNNFPDTQRILFEKLSMLDNDSTPLLEMRLRLLPYNELQMDNKIEAQINKRLYSKLQYAKDDGALALKYALRYNAGCTNAFHSMVAYMRKTQDETLIQYLQYCFDILAVPKYEPLAQKCNTLLQEMLEFSQDREISYEFRADIRYYSARIAGLISNMDIKIKRAAIGWEEWLQNSDDDTDVKNGFEQGVLTFLNRKDIQ